MSSQDLCDVCKTPLRRSTKYGICAGSYASAECKRERQRRKNNSGPPRPKKFCMGCGTRLPRCSRTGFCMTNPECKEKMLAVRNLSIFDSSRKCENCSGPIALSNRTCFCNATVECTKLAQAQANRTRAAVKIGLVTREQLNELTPVKSRELVEKVRTEHFRQRAEAKNAKARERGKGQKHLLLEDGILDDWAIHLAATGHRKVALTPAERIEVVRKMLRMGKSTYEMCNQIGMSAPNLHKILDGLGMEVVIDRTGGVDWRIILPKDRERRKLLEHSTRVRSKP